MENYVEDVAVMNILEDAEQLSRRYVPDFDTTVVTGANKAVGARIK